MVTFSKGNQVFENQYPWGSQEPIPKFHGNFNLFSFAPTPVGYFPNGKSEFGVYELVNKILV